MKSLTRNANLAICLLLYGIAWPSPGSAVALGQEESPDAQNVVHNAPESITGTLEGNKADLLNTWRLLSDLAVQLFSGNHAELLSGNAPELLSGNETTLLSENDPNLLSGNKVVLFSHNTLQIHVTESGNNNTPTQDALARNLSAHPNQRRSHAQQAKRLEAKTQARGKAAESRAKAVIEKEKAQAKTFAKELSMLRARVQELAAQNSDLQAKIAELEAEGL